MRTTPSARGRGTAGLTHRDRNHGRAAAVTVALVAGLLAVLHPVGFVAVGGVVAGLALAVAMWRRRASSHDQPIAGRRTR